MTSKNGAQRNALFSRIFGNNIAWMRERVAWAIIQCGVGPNTLSALGLACTGIAGVFLALGAGNDYFGPTRTPGHGYGVLAGIMLIVASAFDMLDGAVAKKSGQTTRLGAFLDSCFDRIADGIIFLGIMIYFLHHQKTTSGELIAIAAVVALVHAQVISYIKACAEKFIGGCPVGYWQRGERMAGILIGLFSGHIATVMVMLAILPALTVLRRLIFCARQIHCAQTNPPPTNLPVQTAGIMKLALWRYPRGTLPYDLVTAFNIAIILFVDVQNVL